ncbi:MAG: peptide chain release factor N(5)-glutamine methyltransferase [Alphaproteobacteria bacterium]|nr:peptide chain release factor N(5)-glutamine methyltransferase [Alphaproteobacteria bacterium]
MRHAYVAAVRRLRDAGVATPELDARLLLAHSGELSREDFMAQPDRELAPETAARFAAAILRRAGGEPVSRITGMREFYGREFRLDRHTLDPRPDTETLIEAALDFIARKAWHDAPLRLLDLGTGTGCILLTLLAELPNACGVGADISDGTLAVAKANARRLGLESRATFMTGDWFDGMTGTFDLILTNPPYVASNEIAGLAREVKDHDPRRALDGGADGLDSYRRIAAKAAAFLAPGGAVILEIGAGQADAVRDLFRTGSAGLDEPALRHDLSGRPRVVLFEGAKVPEQNVAA